MAFVFVAGISATAAIATTAAVVGAGVSAYGQYQAGQSQKSMANYSAKLAENEAIAKEQQSHAESLQMRKDMERMKASQRAGYAKSGAIQTEGTPLLVMAEQAGMMELDVLNYQRNRALEASSLRQQASMYKYEGKQAARAATIGAVGTFLGGVGSAGMKMASAPKAPTSQTPKSIN